MSNDRIKEEVKFATEMFRLVWLSALGVGGGTVSLVLGELSVSKVSFAAAGLVAMIGLGIVLQRLHRQICLLLAEIKE